MSTREESYSGYPLWIVPLTGGDAPEPDGHPNAVRIYADENQNLRTVKSDGTDETITVGSPSWYGPFPFAHNTPNLNAGVTLLTPTAGDILTNFFAVVTVAFNGTTPYFDFGQGGSLGIIDWVAARSVAGASSSVGTTQIGQTLSFVTPGILSADPLKMWVSQDAVKGGAAVGGTTGAGKLYVEIARPVLL